MTSYKYLLNNNMIYNELTFLPNEEAVSLDSIKIISAAYTFVKNRSKLLSFYNGMPMVC